MAAKKIKDEGSAENTNTEIVDSEVTQDDTPVVDDTVTEKPDTKSKITSMKIKKDIPLDRMIHIYNGSPGGLTIKLPKEGYDIRFEKFKEDDYIPYGELRLLRNASPKFFEENWILFDDEDIDMIDALNAQRFYKGALNPNQIDEFILESSEDKIRSTVSKLSNGQKKLVGYRAVELIDDGILDSRKIINVLEETLGVDLIEKG